MMDLTPVLSGTINWSAMSESLLLTTERQVLSLSEMVHMDNKEFAFTQEYQHLPKLHC